LLLGTAWLGGWEKNSRSGSLPSVFGERIPSDRSGLHGCGFPSEGVWLGEIAGGGAEEEEAGCGFEGRHGCGYGVCLVAWLVELSSVCTLLYSRVEIDFCC
jgi:hypothetical protein